MITDTEIKLQGIEALTDALGEVHAEHFISLILRESCDYTTWQRKLWQNKSAADISEAAVKFRQEKIQS